MRATTFCWITFLPMTAMATDWYVAPPPDGVDGANGREATPLATFAHAVSRANANDRILLRRGGTYFVSDATVAELEVSAYGDGADPVLTSSFEVDLPNTWTTNTNVRTGSVADRVLAVYVDGRFVRLARYPNYPDFLRIDNDDDPDMIADAELSDRPGVAAGRWTGAQVRWRRWSWWWETRPISNHSPVNTLVLGPENRYSDNFSNPGSGYFIDNDLDELDDPGEWMWEGGTLYLYPPTGANPATMRVEVVTSEANGIVARGATFTGVQFQRFFGTAVEVEDRPATFEACTFAELETYAIFSTWAAQPLLVRRSIFRDVRNVAIKINGNPGGPTGTLIERNLFLRIGMERGYGGSGPWHAAGIIISNANAAVVRLNRFVDTGYAGVILGSDGQTVERNVFVRTMGTLNDGGAVYTNCDASLIRENIILDTIGDLETSHPWYPLGHAIWPEFLQDFADSVITDNTMYGSNGFGLFLPNNFTCTVTGNVAVDNRRAGFDLSGDTNDNQDHTIDDNILAAVVPGRRIVRPENLSEWWLPPYAEPTTAALRYEVDIDYGTMSGTTFIAPASGADVIVATSGSTYDTLAAWTTAEPDWASATNSEIVRANAILLFNDTEAAATMDVPAGTWTLPDGDPVGSTVTIQPFRSVVLVTSAAVPADPPYYAASGIDWRADVPVTTVLGETPVDPDGGPTDGAPTDGGPTDGTPTDGGPTDGAHPGGDTDPGHAITGSCGDCSGVRGGWGALPWVVCLSVVFQRLRRRQRFASAEGADHPVLPEIMDG